MRYDDIILSTLLCLNDWVTDTNAYTDLKDENILD